MPGCTYNNFLSAIAAIFCFTCHAQKVEVLHRSDYRHNYAVGWFHYVEEAADTARLKYVATLRIRHDGFPYVSALFAELFKTQGKELGANMYRLASYVEIDSSIAITVRVYFAPEKFFVENESKRKKGHIYIFSGERRPALEQHFSYNDSIIKFPSLMYYDLEPPDKSRVGVHSDGPRLPGLHRMRTTFKAAKEASFMVVGNKMPNVTNSALTMAAIFALTAQSPVIVIPLGKQNSRGMESLPYHQGRLLLDIYKCTNR